MASSTIMSSRRHGHSASIPIPLANMDYTTMGPNLFSTEEAERISSMIDEELKKEYARKKEARKKEVNVMLLGQAESGKSTLQKQFQLYYASQSLEHERPSWRPVVYFNIIKAVRMILDELDYQFLLASQGEPRIDPALVAQDVQDEIAALRGRLLPLVAMEDSLATELSGGVSIAGGRAGAFVRSGWQALVSSTSASASSSSLLPLTNSANARAWSPSVPATVKLNEVASLAAKTLASLTKDVDALWKHRAVKSLLELRKLRLDESAPFFLDSLWRICEAGYLPTTDDILNVRIQTLGVMEHSFPITMGGTTYNWKLYDVGGARGQRQAWVPYFEDATAIIFLAPISAFDQYLEEDPRTNRIDDSLQLFTAICANRLLKSAHLVLLLNKADILKKKLDAGIKVKKYITSFAERPNEYEAVAEYFRSHFVQVHRRKDASHRQLYVHFTSMLDTKAMQSIISNVGEAILHQHIASVGLA